MPDWRALVRTRLAGAGISPTTEMDLVDELSQHLEDRYRQLCAEGLSDEDATVKTRLEIESDEWLLDLTKALGEE